MLDLDIPAHSDSCWDDATWRTQTLVELMDRFRLNAREVGEYTGDSANSVRMWRSSSTRKITPAKLRLFMLELGRSNLDLV